jgi:hypothetical protein
MTKYVTEITAINPKTGEMSKWIGPNVPGVSIETAQQYCDSNGLGYCKVIGRLVAEIPFEGNGVDY